ncbi:MAG: hypothetical protein ACXWC4_00750 [Telluria sp.]
MTHEDPSRGSDQAAILRPRPRIDHTPAIVFAVVLAMRSWQGPLALFYGVREHIVSLVLIGMVITPFNVIASWPAVADFLSYVRSLLRRGESDTAG